MQRSKIKQRRGERTVRRGYVWFRENVVQGCFPEKVTFEEGFDSDGRITMMLSGECSRHREQQDPEMGACPACSKTNKDVVRWKKDWRADSRLILDVFGSLACPLSGLGSS